jgi:hypothetical protein
MDIFCFGDSHSKYFKKCNTLTWSGVLSNTAPKVTAFDSVAASAKGFAAGPKSRFAYKKFMRDFEANAPEFVCLAYGQVDAEVGYYFRKYVQGSTATPEDDLGSVYDAYIAMANETVPARPIVFKGPNPSTLRIDTQLLNYIYRRLVVRISKESERTDIWNRMNDDPPVYQEHARINVIANTLLREKVEKAGHVFFDIRAETEDPDHPGMARWEFVPAESDVHLTDSYHVRRAYAEKLFAAFEGI